MALLELAQQLRGSGLSVIPVAADGTKRPDLLTWKEYQTRRPSDEELRRFFSNGCGIAVICGQVSGQLELLDFETGAPFEEWRSLVREHEADLISSLVIIRTPSLGWHALYRCEQRVEGNQKLAKRTDGTVLIETRGEGGYFLTVGCPPACHPSGKIYQYEQGRLRHIPTITSKQRGLLLDVARSFNEYRREMHIAAHASNSGRGRPGDFFNERE